MISANEKQVFFCFSFFKKSGKNKGQLSECCVLNSFFKIVLDLNVKTWCQDYFLDHSALNIADTIRSELTSTLNRIELPISEPAFGTKTNTNDIKRALLAGFFMQVRNKSISVLFLCTPQLYSFLYFSFYLRRLLEMWMDRGIISF